MDGVFTTEQGSKNACIASGIGLDDPFGKIRPSYLSKDEVMSGRKDHSWPILVRLVKATQNVWPTAVCE